jgi:hypothetical protein
MVKDEITLQVFFVTLRRGIDRKPDKLNAEVELYMKIRE